MPTHTSKRSIGVFGKLKSLITSPSSSLLCLINTDHRNPVIDAGQPPPTSKFIFAATTLTSKGRETRIENWPDTMAYYPTKSLHPRLNSQSIPSRPKRIVSCSGQQQL
ncbi:hypothetical protein AVEN_273577-1 [Araneus ventricosus]|uniref:Uncharacterized protein n=1 Tax=Araneus ventricosus TaxID=182803 RepID=A0A4Y2DMJ0_ARAVE|nr:hypothetical protein AVEN_223776-1 [Araneus ventricosus]GBM46272.1 hypothetical protein AVEN_273577-1 [Araneus ventricosus]